MKVLTAILLTAFAVAESPRFEIENIPEELGDKIVESLKELKTLKEYPKGFQRIEDVRWDWISIAHFPDRAAIYKGYFLFPELDTARDTGKWDSGIAIKKNSPYAYTWKLDNE